MSDSESAGQNILALVRVATAQRTSVQALYLMWTSTMEKIDEFYTIPWYDPTKGRRDNKDRMKELGGALGSVRDRLFELVILGMAKVVEDALYDLGEELEKPISFWKLPFDPKCYRTVILIRSLSNLIKHHHSYVIAGSCRDSDRLISEYNVRDESRIDLLTFRYHDDPQQFDPILLLHHTDVFVSDLSAGVLGIKIEIPQATYEEVHSLMEHECSPVAIREYNQSDRCIAPYPTSNE